jgi:hypothetical protein
MTARFHAGFQNQDWTGQDVEERKHTGETESSIIIQRSEPIQLGRLPSVVRGGKPRSLPYPHTA